MNTPHTALHQAADTIVDAARRVLAERGAPILVAIDGGSGAGKSTLATLVATALGATEVPSDDFFAADIPDAGWDARSTQERSDDGIDWRRLRSEAIEPLLAGKTARWHAFDFVAGQRPDGTYPMQTAWTEREPADVIVVDGAYSARPELADLIDLAVLVDVPVETRHARLDARDEADFSSAWHARWDAVEEYYFTQIRPPSAFDLVVTTE